MTAHAEMMGSFYAARERREREREAFSYGYATEASLYDEDNPPVKLRDFMGQSATAAPPGVCSHGFYFVDCTQPHGDDERPPKLRPAARKAWNRSLAALAREAGVYADVMAAWSEVTELRMAGLTPEGALARLTQTV